MLTREERFWSFVSKDDDSCWRWKGAKTGNGYGLFWNGQRLVTAHRWLYQQKHGEIDSKLVLDHLCRVRGCVNPEHLEPVTARENILRGVNDARLNMLKTHCPQGHPYDGDNIYLTKKGQRQCRTCKRDQDKARKAGRPPHPSARTTCSKGHEYTPDNLSHNQKGYRVCLTCKRAQWRKENAKRFKGFGLPGLRTHCPQGHPYDEANTYRPPSGGRTCLTCKAEKQRERRRALAVKW